MAAPRVATIPGAYTLTATPTITAQYVIALTGNNWTERLITAGKFSIHCDTGTGNAFAEVSQGKGDAIIQNNLSLDTTISGGLNGNTPDPIIKWIYGDTSNRIYKVLQVLDNDTIIVEQITANGTVIGIPYAVANKGYGITKVEISMAPGETATAVSNNGSVVYTITDGGVATVPVNGSLTGPLALTGDADVLIQ